MSFTRKEDEQKGLRDRYEAFALHCFLLSFGSYSSKMKKKENLKKKENKK